jgi:hypothetical protein
MPLTDPLSPPHAPLQPRQSGVVAALLSHREGAAFMAADPDLGRAVRGVVHAVDIALTEVIRGPWVRAYCA